ncbi:hypothetical protein STEG23_028619, partial [Scotinomys teguina]
VYLLTVPVVMGTFVLLSTVINTPDSAKHTVGSQQTGSGGRMEDFTRITNVVMRLSHSYANNIFIVTVDEFYYYFPPTPNCF